MRRHSVADVSSGEQSILRVVCILSLFLALSCLLGFVPFPAMFEPTILVSYLTGGLIHCYRRLYPIYREWNIISWHG